MIYVFLGNALGAVLDCGIHFGEFAPISIKSDLVGQVVHNFDLIEISDEFASIVFEFYLVFCIFF